MQKLETPQAVLKEVQSVSSVGKQDSYYEEGWELVASGP